MNETDPNLAGYQALGADVNKQKGASTPDTAEGIVSEKLSELTLDMEDSEIVKLTDKWEKIWNESTAKAEWETQIEENEKYWLGKQFDQPGGKKERPMVDNIMFESLETYLPQATRRNPDPIVTLDASEDTDRVKEKYIEKVKNRLSDISDKNKIRLKLKKGARHWAIYQLGVAKFGWDLDNDIPVVRIIRPKKVYLDPDSTIDEDGYTGDRIGEARKMTADKIIAIVGEQEDTIDPQSGEIVQKGNTKAIEYLKEKVKGDLATEVGFKEWWTTKYMCWKLDSHILMKKKNPHWNYDSESTEEVVDDYGNTTSSAEQKKGINHFSVPKMPYAFLSVFNLGDQPMDKTSLMGQNLANQDRINKRDKQIDKNADRMNGGLVVSLARSGLTKDQAGGVAKALRKGGVVVIPDGSPREAIDQYNPVGLPVDVFNDRNDTRERLRDIFGVSGSSQAGLKAEDTVRGKIISRATDTDRIGGGVTEYLEQWCDDWYNWIVQLLYVYDTGFQFIEGGVPPKIVVSVKEGSLLPKDSTSIANQALELAGLNRIANIDLYERLEWPNAKEVAANVWLETNAPQLLYADNPMVQQAIQMQQQAAQIQAQEKAESERTNMERKGAIDIEKEMVRDSNKRSMLKEV